MKTLSETSRADRFIGNEQDNVFDGKKSQIYSPKYNQTIFTDVDGDDYFVMEDVVEYNGNQADFTIAGSSDNFTVSGSGIGTDTLIDIEFLKFDDGLVAVDDSLFV